MTFVRWSTFAARRRLRASPCRGVWPVVVVGALGCATSGQPAAETGVTAGVRTSKLTAALVPTSSNVRGSVDLDPGAGSRSRVRIQLRGAPVGAQHGWQIRSGRCGETTSQVVGSAAAYPAVPVRADGTADLTITVPVALDASQQYNVALFANRTDIDGVIACGNLTQR